tara:strand:- start:5749 stop:6537 length:789 start_codon:yes stop_codon:yes gene_type:complete
MSLAALKKRTKNTYRTSRLNNNPEGFSINGPHRNIGRVGESMAMSKNTASHNNIYIPGKGCISVQSGNGGQNGKYYEKTKLNCRTCNLPRTSKRSAMNTHGLLNKQKQRINHNIVVQQTNKPEDHTQSNYIENHLVPHMQGRKKCLKQDKHCKDKPCKTKRINSKLIYPKKITKDLTTMDGTEYITRRKTRYATLPTVQYDIPWPLPSNSSHNIITGNGCNKAQTKENFDNTRAERVMMAQTMFDCNNKNPEFCNKHNTCSC